MTKHLDLDALQAAAEAAIKHGDAIGEPDWHQPGYAITMEATCPDAALICACSPHMILALIERLRKAEAASKWISVDERMPELDAECLVLSQQPWGKVPSIKIDTWREQHECPFSSQTVPIGPGWDEHDDFYFVTHWRPLPAAPDSTPTDSADSEGAKG